MWQTDTIHHGLNLADHIDPEFGHRADRWADDDRDPPATAEFWRDYLQPAQRPLDSARPDRR